MSCILLIYFVLSLVFTGFSATLPKKWHESNGYGTKTEAGLGGKVYKVTNLKNSGPGSLRDGVENSGPRLIVFEVGGIIDLNDKRLVISKDNITIAGQTAPSPGITLIRGNLAAYANNVVVSHITVQLGDEVKGFPDCVNISDKGNQNIVFNHVSVFWSKDENLSMNGPKNVTLYKCLIAEALQYCGHEDGEHSKGSLIFNPQNLSLIGTLYAHNAMRNPRSKDGKMLIVNGVVYNWAPGWDHKGPVAKSNEDLHDQFFNYIVHLRRMEISFVGNVGIQGPNSRGEIFVDGHQGGPGSAYMEDNIIIDKKGKELTLYNNKEIKRLNSPPLWPKDLKSIPAHESIYEVLRTAGSRPGDRDKHNARIIRTIADGTGKVIDSQNDVGGYADYSVASRSVKMPDGKKARRVWLDSLEDEIAIDREIDLSRIYKFVGSKESDKYASATEVIAKEIPALKIRSIRKYTNAKQINAHVNLPTVSNVSMIIFNVAGNVVVPESSRQLQAGGHEMISDINHLTAGVYICRFKIENSIFNLLYHCY